MTAPGRACGTCTACCRVFAVPETNKTADEWCRYCDPKKGCQVYNARPERCVDFQCLWLASQATRNPLPDALRPDRCKIVFAPSTNPRVMTAITLPGYPLAWMDAKPRALIDLLNRGGMAVAIGPPNADANRVIGPDGKGRIVKLTPPDENGMRWSQTKEGE